MGFDKGEGVKILVLKRRGVSRTHEDCVDLWASEEESRVEGWEKRKGKGAGSGGGSEG